MEAFGLQRGREMIQLSQRFRSDLPVAREQCAGRVETAEPNRVEAELAKMPSQWQRGPSIRQTSDASQVDAKEAQPTGVIVDEVPAGSAHEAVCTSGLVIQRREIGQRAPIVESRCSRSELLRLRDLVHTLRKVLLRTATHQQREGKKRARQRRYGDCAVRATQTMVPHLKRPITARILRTIMLESRSFLGCLTGLVLALTLAPSVALAANKDKAARQLQTEAMQTDYAETNFKKSEQKLKKAITQCGASNCSNQVVAELHRDLATVYIAGLKQSQKGKTELKHALKADPDLQLNEDFATPELRKLFKQLGGHEAKPEVEEKPAKEKEKEQPKDESCDSESGTCLEEEPAKGDSTPSKGAKNWLSLHFEQDLLLYPAQDNVCGSGTSPDAANYSCFQHDAPFNGTITPGPGNHVAGGLGRGTMRLLLGFDRVLGSNISLGLRVGYAFGGRPAGSDKFSPLHLELRGNYWFGSAPFEGSGVRPYLSISGGMAEVDGKVAVEYYDETNSKKTVDAWRKTGKGFAGLAFGVMVPFAGNNGIVPELRAMQMFGASGTVFDLSIGYARGF